MNYAAIKLLHQAAVIVSGLGFALRAAASLMDAPWTRSRLAKTLPHVVDSVLLASAVTLAAMLQLNPLHTPWLLAKICGLLVYIGLGMVALRPRFTARTRAGAAVLALATLGWIASIAILKSPWGFLLLLATEGS